MIFDKKAAQNGRDRIPEANLFILSLAGGAFGVYAGMLTARHKTRKLNFRLLIPLICLGWLFIVFY